MNILLLFPGFILALIIVIYYECKMKNVINEAYKNKNVINEAYKNKVRFYVARDKDGSLWLYAGKPIKSRFSFVSGRFGKAVTLSNHFSKFGLNINDYDNLKWEDEPVEVFVNMED